MERIAFVSSFYRIFEDNQGYASAIIERLKVLTTHIPIYLFCSKKDEKLVSGLENVTPIYKEFEDYEMYKVLHTASRLPEYRNPEKDTKEYMILMNMKSECINLTKFYVKNESKHFSHFVWLDAGITKIFSDPDKTLLEFVKKINTVELPTNKVIIPGCWPSQHNLLLLERQICWRFCGGFLVIPSNLVEYFYMTNLQSCKDIRSFCDKVLWEVNVWAFMETKLPIEWRKGDHNESILSI